MIFSLPFSFSRNPQKKRNNKPKTGLQNVIKDLLFLVKRREMWYDGMAFLANEFFLESQTARLEKFVRNSVGRYRSRLIFQLPKPARLAYITIY